MKVSEWTEEKGKNTTATYVFVSFTSTHFLQDNFNKKFLNEVGMHAAKRAKASAYWVSTSCLCDLDEKDEEKKQRQTEETVWDMSDIIRGAEAIAIAVPGNLNPQFEGTSLREWGERVWTMPELLLYTGKRPVIIYERDKCLDQDWQRSLDRLDNSPSDSNYDQPRSLDHRGQSPSDPNHQEPVDERLWNPRELPRRELWSKVWSDPEYSGQLIDHYEQSLALSRLQLVTVALNCLYKRETKIYLDGDISYVLMGLLRHRPNIVPSDSDFQAFARLSLANDSNRLLERMICLLPKTLEDEWWSLSDAWDVMLWDIEPTVQICGIGDNDTVIIDGARGATIHWDKFVSVLTIGHESSIRTFIRLILGVIPRIVISGIVSLVWALADSRFASLANVYSYSILGTWIIFIGLSPFLLRLLYSARPYDSEPFFFGIEGYLDIYNLELLIFGSYERRLRWSTASSPLSRHGLDRKGMKADFFQDENRTEKSMEELMTQVNMYTGLDPVKIDQYVNNRVEKGKTSSHNDKKIFTLIDTYTMTVTLFEAIRPPVAILLCGDEGGMQRALLCSEDWTKNILYRETVLRMETRVWSKMEGVSRVRLALNMDDNREPVKDPKDLRSDRDFSDFFP